jgi:hypothetical protein
MVVFHILAECIQDVVPAASEQYFARLKIAISNQTSTDKAVVVLQTD